MKYLYSEWDDSYFTVDSEDECEDYLDVGCDELTEEQYFKKLKQQESRMSDAIDFGQATTKAAEEYKPGKDLPPVGWGTSYILFHRTDQKGVFIEAQTTSGLNWEIVFWFGGKFPDKKAPGLFAKMLACCGIAPSGKKHDGSMYYQEPDIVKAYGRNVDAHIWHSKSKKLKDDGTPFVNPKADDFAKAGTEAGSGTGTAQQQQASDTAEPKTGAAAFGADGPPF